MSYKFTEDGIDFYSARARGYLIAGTTAEAQAVYDVLLAPIAAPIDHEILDADPTYGPTADQMMRHLIRRVFIEPGIYDQIIGDVSDPVILAKFAQELGDNLVNVDGVRSYETRRLTVDVLKQIQSIDGYLSLNMSRDYLAMELASGSLSGDDQLLTQDLLNRIDAAINPYFN